jgi:hypothetical protein
VRTREKQKLEDKGSTYLATVAEIRLGITQQKCPFCHNPRSFRELAQHTYHMHGISAYDLREMAGLNRGESICDPIFSAECAERSPNSEAFLKFDRSVIASIRETEERPQARESRLRFANSPEHIVAFREAIKNVDFKAIAQRVPPEVRKGCSRLGFRALRKKYGDEQIKKWMLEARSKRTPESETKRIEHAQKTMRTYWDNPLWRMKWRKAVSQGARKHAKISSDQHPSIRERVKRGESLSVISQEYGVSKSLIWLIGQGRKR